jgi:hypothetical protein
MKKGLVLDVPMPPRTGFKATACPSRIPPCQRNNHPNSHPADQHTRKLSPQVFTHMADERRQYISSQFLVTACLDALMYHVNIPKGYVFLYTDVFGHDGCLAEAVLQASVRDPGRARSCITLCHDTDSKSYISNLIGTAVFKMAKSKQLDIPGFPDLQKVGYCHQPSSDSGATLRLEATVYLPGQRALVVLERHVKQWMLDPRNGGEPQTYPIEHWPTSLMLRDCVARSKLKHCHS